jgi:hypothetical protein
MNMPLFSSIKPLFLPFLIAAVRQSLLRIDAPLTIVGALPLLPAFLFAQLLPYVATVVNARYASRCQALAHPVRSPYASSDLGVWRGILLVTEWVIQIISRSIS